MNFLSLHEHTLKPEKKKPKSLEQNFFVYYETIGFIVSEFHSKSQRNKNTAFPIVMGGSAGNYLMWVSLGDIINY